MRSLHSTRHVEDKMSGIIECARQINFCAGMGYSELTVVLKKRWFNCGWIAPITNVIILFIGPRLKRVFIMLYYVVCAEF